MGEDTGTIIEKVAPAAPISILECFNLEKRLSEGMQYMVKAIEYKFKEKTPTSGAVYNLYCLIMGDLIGKGEEVPREMNYGMFCKLYKVEECSDEPSSV